MLMVERKSGTVDNVLRVLREKKVLDRITLHAFDWDFIAEAHRQEPKLVLGALGQKDMNAEKIAEAASIGATIINWKAADLTREAIALAHDTGLRVWSWTIDDPAVAQRLLDAGLNGLISNVPAKIKPLLS
jgi:glycerophosphoryl diester phosphodiesterase